MRRYAFALCLALLPAVASAQNAAPVLPAGDAAVAGFSGTVVVGAPAEARRIDKTYINLAGPALRVIGLGGMGGPPQGQLVAAPKPFTATAGQIGQVFSLALDDASPPNIYAAATSAYGLPIVVPDADGDGIPDRSRRGAPNAAFMPGLFGPVQADGGPGSIWKIDGRNGAVSLFANVTLGGVRNSGPALGGLTFDPASRQLFVADRDTGMIHRFTLDGVERGRFDHGMQALATAGLPPIAFDPRKRLNIESPAFDSGNPGTWAYAPATRRVFGMAVNGGRLYYAVASGLRIWSVALLPDGSFGTDARVEVAVARGAPASAEISEILFDGGDMLVAERGAPTGAYDYKALAEAGENRVLRFRPRGPNDPPGRDLWFPVPKEYAVGFPPNYRNDNGGIAIGYGYDPAGNINRAVCGGTLWSTGEQLRNARDRAIVQRLQSGGPLIIDGLQGISTRLLRPLNEPPSETYFVDYDDRFEDPQTRGHLGDVVIWRTCGQAALPLVPVALICPLGLFEVDGVCRFPPTCPAGTEFSNGCCGYRDCPASYVRINGKCVPPPANCNPREILSEGGRCEAPKCPPGMEYVNSQAGGGSGPGGLTAPNSGALSPGALNQLQEAQQRLNRDKPKSCSGGGYCRCPEGTQRSEDGTCKPPSGCGLNMVLNDGECVCADGFSAERLSGSNVATGILDGLFKSKPKAACCPRGQRFNPETNKCEPPTTPRCDPSDPASLVVKDGKCVCADGTPSLSRSSGPVAGLSGQSCCPTGRHLNTVTNKCDPDSSGKPHLTIVKKKPDSCTLMSNDGQVSIYRCTFTITIANDGTAPATNIPPVIDTPTAGTIVDVQSDGSWNCGVGTNTATCQRPSALGAGDSTWITVTLEQSSGNYAPNSGQIRDGGITEAQNCAAIDTSGVLQAGQAINPGLLGDLAGQSLKSCDRIRIPRNPRNPPVTTCTPTRMPPCSGPSNNPTGRPLCHVGECDCPLIDGRNLCGPSTCMTTCPASATPPLPPPPPPPPTITVDCPAGMSRGFNGQCFFVDPGCRGPNCPPVTTGCADGSARNSDGNCPTPGTGSQPTCGFPKTLIAGQCVCRGGTVGDDCHVPSCDKGEHMANGKCVADEKKKKKRKPKSNDDDTPKQTAPTIDLNIGIGIGGGSRGGGGKQNTPPPLNRGGSKG